MKISQHEMFARMGLKSKVLSGPLNILSALVGFYTSRPQQGVNYQLFIVLKRGEAL
jgi:hypothetical protein